MSGFRSQLDAMESLLDINKLLDEKAHSQGLTFTAMDPSLRVANGLSTGVYAFDLITGGGYAPGRFSYLYGDTGSAKSTTLYHGIHSSLSNDILTVLNDHEASMDPTYLKKIGIDLDAVCGVRNKKGTWEVTPKLRYSVGTTAESTFKFMNLVMKALPDKIQLLDSKTDTYRYFVISPEYDYKPVWASINKGLKEEKIIEVEDFSPQMVFITDSLKAMLPEAKDVDIDSDPIALQARSFSSNFPLVKSLIGRKNCIYLATNHLTVNPMARFGCLHGDTPVPFVDGRSFPIREIVEKRIEGDVWSYDEITKKIVPAKIVDWYFNGEVEYANDFITIKSGALETSNGAANLTVTRSHRVLTLDGWKRAEDITTRDSLVSKYESKINGTLKSFLLGTVIGDSHITSRHENGIHKLLFQDKRNPEYLQWKVDKLGEHFSFKKQLAYRHGEYVPVYHSETRHDFTALKRKIRDRDPNTVIDEMDDLSLAVWFMDDGSGEFNNGHSYGTLSVGRLKGDIERLEKLRDGLQRKGIDCTINITKLQLNKAAFALFCARICRYVPPCMQYKLLPEFRDKYQDFDLECDVEYMYDYVPVWSVKEGSNRKFSRNVMSKRKYDIKVEGTHNYLAGSSFSGVIVHNSPEAEPGGKAVQFYPDLKIKMHINRAQSKIVEETHVSGEGIDRYIVGKATVLKNKAGPCFRTIPFRVWLDEQGAPGRGIDPVFDTHTFLENCGLIEELSKTQFGIKLKGWETQKFDWKKFKSLILLDAEGQVLRNQIHELMASGKAQEMYYQYLATQMGVTKAADKDAGENIEVVEI